MDSGRKVPHRLGRGQEKSRDRRRVRKGGAAERKTEAERERRKKTKALRERPVTSYLVTYLVYLKFMPPRAKILSSF